MCIGCNSAFFFKESLQIQIAFREKNYENRSLKSVNNLKKLNSKQIQTNKKRKTY